MVLQRVMSAAISVLGPAVGVAHLSATAMVSVPIPGLQAPAILLLQMWNSFQSVNASLCYLPLRDTC
jgi:hypothetical protein